MNILRAAALAALFPAVACVHAGTVEVTISGLGGKPLDDAAVVLEPLVAAPARNHAAATVEQRDREFIPYLTIVQAGTAIDFPNSDSIKHHVYSFSPAKPFEIKLYAGKPAQPVVFDKPGEVMVGCNIHDWMEAHILVVNSPYFAKTARSGRAAISNVPAGRYRLRLWHPRQKTAIPAREVEVGAAPLRLHGVLDAGPAAVKPKSGAEAEQY